MVIISYKGTNSSLLPKFNHCYKLLTRRWLKKTTTQPTGAKPPAPMLAGDVEGAAAPS